MAVLTDVGCLHVRGVLTGRVCAVVTACTIARDVDVIEVGRCPARCRMTVIAVVAADNMIGIFARCDDAIMAGTTAADDIEVIDRENGRERVCRMTVLTGIGRQNMADILAGCVGAVVTGDAIAHDVCVIKYGWRPCDRVVTVIALFTRCNMRLCFAGRLYTVMTGTAVACNG